MDRYKKSQDDFVKSYEKYIGAKGELKRTVNDGLHILGVFCFYCIPIYFVTRILSLIRNPGITIFLLFLLPVVFDICLYLRWREQPPLRKDDDTFENGYFKSSFFKWVAPKSSYIAWMILILIYIYVMSKADFLVLAGLLGVAMCFAVIIYRVYVRDKVYDDIKKLNERQDRICNFFEENENRTNGKFKYVFCVGSIDTLHKIYRKYLNWEYHESYAIYRVPKKFSNLAEFGNVAIGKRFFRSTEDSKMLIIRTFSADKENPDIPELTSIELPKKKYISECYKSPKEYVSTELQPCAILAKGIIGSSLAQSNTYNRKLFCVNENRDSFGCTFDCLVPEDIPIDKLSLNSFIIAEDYNGNNTLMQIVAFITKDRDDSQNAKESGFYFRHYPQLGELERFIDAATTDDEVKKRAFFRLFKTLSTYKNVPYMYVKARIEY